MNVNECKYVITGYAGSVSASGGYGGGSASVTVDVESVSEKMKAGSKFGSEEEKFKIGGGNMPEPIAIRLISIQKMFDVKLYSAYKDTRNSRIPCRFSRRLLSKRSKNIIKALEVYPSTLNVRLPTAKILFGGLEAIIKTARMMTIPTTSPLAIILA
ncbi:hypothetical protein AC249_AIPGENE12409 [Exaiptasia diaphana]|nr:hypothetical protein AC249_AIPGENE12409 [Exaiptasia diaphana]